MHLGQKLTLQFHFPGKCIINHNPLKILHSFSCFDLGLVTVSYTDWWRFCKSWGDGEIQLIMALTNYALEKNCLDYVIVEI